MNEHEIPDDLKELDGRWLCWRPELAISHGQATEPVPGHVSTIYNLSGQNHAARRKPAKVPYSPKTGKRASSTCANDWTDYEHASKFLVERAEFFVGGGLGFVFHKSDGMVGLDFDRCLDESEDGSLKVRPAVAGLVERFSDTYTEISPSGSGLKLWARGSIPANIAGIQIGDCGLEAYDHARFFAVTGRRFRNAPLQVEDHARDLLLLYRHLRGQTESTRAWPLQPLQSGKIPHGQQHSTLVSIAGTLRARRVCDQAIRACLLAINQYQCERPGPDSHIERIVSSTRNWEKRES